jgi:hypothetical protein
MGRELNFINEENGPQQFGLRIAQLTRGHKIQVMVDDMGKKKLEF